AWRIQENALGGLSERARRRALEIANDSDLRISAPKGFLDGSPDQIQRTAAASIASNQDQRLPIAGTLLASACVTRMSSGRVSK
ncbi:MAG: DUF2924 domain-containing protein, partial [Acidobacteriota bacterium]|nr:DUF2924 domain-containing protein [Acidobacteriota bacterium]